MTTKVTDILRAGDKRGAAPFDRIVLMHDERHLRRKVMTLAGGEKALLDLPQAITLGHGDCLVLEDGRLAEVVAAEEDLYAVTARDRLHLTELAWHLGNRHLPAQIEATRIVILRDHVIKAMLEGLGATVATTREPFVPVRGAYHSDTHGHDEHAHHDHRHKHDHH